MAKCELHGTKQDGIEYRWDGEQLDEIVVYVGGKVVLHVEQMSDTTYWMGIYVDGWHGHANFGSTNRRSHVTFYTAEAMRELTPKEPATPGE
mgnify:CR=1 FL=1